MSGKLLPDETSRFRATAELHDGNICFNTHRSLDARLHCRLCPARIGGPAAGTRHRAGKASSTIDVHNTQKDGYKWYVKGMWFPSTSPSMYEILPSYSGASGVLEIEDAPVPMSWNFATTFFDNSAPEGYRGTLLLPGKGIYYEARIACADLAGGFYSVTSSLAGICRLYRLRPVP